MAKVLRRCSPSSNLSNGAPAQLVTTRFRGSTDVNSYCASAALNSATVAAGRSLMTMTIIAVWIQKKKKIKGGQCARTESVKRNDVLVWEML
ncbi:hypothetical protein KC320_g4294 [Hortaea werneckii]|nr:hypothetical protein KC320_g4294 [Hortaea werneckii]